MGTHYSIAPSQAGIMANANAAFKFVTETLKWPMDGARLLSFERPLAGAAACGVFVQKCDFAKI